MSDQHQTEGYEESKDVTRRAVVTAAGVTGLAALTGEAAADEPQVQGKFEPNRLTFAQGIERIKKAVNTSGDQASGKDTIITSRTKGFDKVFDDLMVHNLPNGFTKYQLPVFFDGGPGSQFFISVGSPNTEVGRHSHDEGDGMRFIVSGSILYGHQELTAGDWMFIPKGVPYSFKVGRLGVQMFYCYQCCCA